MSYRLFLIALAGILSACSSAPERRHTLKDVDIVGVYKSQPGSRITPKNEKEIRAAYMEYLKHAAKSESSRIDALQRLAQLEFELNEKLASNQDNDTESSIAVENRIQETTLDRSIRLLETSLKDYPNSPTTDITLYQLAKAYDQKGLHDKAIHALELLTKKHPKSKFYIESLFRLAEESFSKKLYTQAEDIYTDVLVTKKNSLFSENARYKRGWARYKQGFYFDAIDDFVAVIESNKFSDYEKLNQHKKNEFDEYFRALGLSFAYTGGATSLNEYFAKHTTFKFIYHAYLHTSNIYASQQRYTDAVDTLDSFIKHHKQSVYVPVAGMKIIDTWKNSGFLNKVVVALDNFYQSYHPESKYWNAKRTKADIYKATRLALKDYIVLAASHYHKEYQTTKKEPDFQKSKMWYDRYLAHYRSHSHKDNIHLLYAELLGQHKDYMSSLAQYEQAAYDGDIILNKDAAYSAVLVTSKLHKNTVNTASGNNYLDKLVKYSLLYARLYPNDPRSMNVMTHAAQEAYRAGLYEYVVKLTETFTSIPYTKTTYNIHLIKAHSYFKLKQYDAAENAYKAIQTQYKLTVATNKSMLDNLATSIYNQATQAIESDNTEQALHHYTRIYLAAPASNVAATGLFDAIALLEKNKRWNGVIQYSKLFQSHYPSHAHNREVSKKLSSAYLNSNQDIAAASELVKISRTEQDADYQIAALWKAGELYESKNDTELAIKTFEEYAKKYTRPYPQYIESIQKLIELHSKNNNQKRITFWRNTVLNTDKRTPGDVKTDRTKFITSQAALSLAKREHDIYSGLRLTLPLKRSLKRKKTAMQKAVTLYGRASSYGVLETTTQATHGIAEIYYSFSKALLESDRPGNLNKTELEQYKILLEDQAIPFEEKAIEFYETNLAHTKDGIYDEWLKKSHAQLKILFPARYNREAKLEPYINVIH